MYNADRSQSNLQFNSSAQTEMPQAQEFLNMSGHGHEMICFCEAQARVRQGQARDGP